MNRRNQVASGYVAYDTITLKSPAATPLLTPLGKQIHRQYRHDTWRQVKKDAISLQRLVDEMPTEIYADGSALLETTKNSVGTDADLGSKLANAGYGVTELILAGAEYSSSGWLLVGTNVIVRNNLYHYLGHVESYNIPDMNVYQYENVFVLVSAQGRIDLHQLAMRLRDSWDIVNVRFVTKPDYEKLAKQRLP